MQDTQTSHPSGDEQREGAAGRRVPRAIHGWWTRRWLRLLPQFFDTGRLAAGRALAEDGRVLSMDVQHGVVTARVMNDNPEAPPYQVRLSFGSLTDAQWQRIIHALAERAIYAAQLLNDELPEEIETVFRSGGASLFPTSLQELGSECTCSDWANTCKHRAAVLFELADRLDQDPFLFFALRGRTREELTSALRVQRALQATGADDDERKQGDSPRGVDPRSLPTDPALFWNLSEELTRLEIHVEPPETEGELLEVLERLSALEDPAIRDKLMALYRDVSRRALRAAQGQPSRDAEGG